MHRLDYLTLIGNVETEDGEQHISQSCELEKVPIWRNKQRFVIV
jgi:hypothetical protein